MVVLVLMVRVVLLSVRVMLIALQETVREECAGLPSVLLIVIVMEDTVSTGNVAQSHVEQTVTVLEENASEEYVEV